MTVVTGHPYYPEWDIYEGYRRSFFRTELHNGVTIRRSWHYVRPNPGPVGRIVHEITLGLFALPNLVRSLRGVGHVFIVSPDLSFAFLTACVCRMMRRPYSLTVQDVMPDAAAELGMLSNRWILKISRGMARYIYNGAESIRTLGEGMRRRIALAAGNPDKISVVPNAVDVNELAPGDGTGTQFRQLFVPDGSFAVVHAGNMGEKQDLGVLLDAASALREHQDIHFLVFGEGAVKEDFLRNRDHRKLENVSVHGFQERALLKHMLRGADAVIISQSSDVVDIVVPSKLQVALAAGAMIIAVCPADSETAEIIRTSDGGILVPAGDGASLAASILKIKSGEINTWLFRSRATAYAAANYDQERLYGPIAESILASAGKRA